MAVGIPDRKLGKQLLLPEVNTCDSTRGLTEKTKEALEDNKRPAAKGCYKNPNGT